MKYDEIISLGSSCCPGLSLRNLNLKKRRRFSRLRKNKNKKDSNKTTYTSVSHVYDSILPLHLRLTNLLSKYSKS